MNLTSTPAPSLISSLEVMIDAFVSSALDRRLGSTRDPLIIQIEAAVAAALDQRLGRAGNDLDKYIQGSIDSAIRQRFGPIGSSISAQITFGAPNSAVGQPAVASTTTTARSSCAPNGNTSLEDLRHDVELVKAHLDMLNENNEDHATNRRVLGHDLAALHERYTSAVDADHAHKRTEPSASETVVVKAEEADIKFKQEPQLVEEQAKSVILSARRTLPVEKKTLPNRKLPDSVWQNPESSSIKRADPAEPIGTAAHISVDRRMATEISNRPRGKALESGETASENLPNDMVRLRIFSLWQEHPALPQAFPQMGVKQAAQEHWTLFLARTTIQILCLESQVLQLKRRMRMRTISSLQSQAPPRKRSWKLFPSHSVG